jgi:hypothetical protein
VVCDELAAVSDTKRDTPPTTNAGFDGLCLVFWSDALGVGRACLLPPGGILVKRFMRRIPALLALSLAATTAGAAPASAGRSATVGYDESGDVWVVPATRSPGGATLVGSPPNADVRGVGVFHGRTAVQARVDYNELDKDAGVFRLRMWLRDQDGRVSVVRLRVDPGKSRLARLHTAGRRVTCARLASSVDYRSDILRLEIPRRCLGNPAVVQFKAVAGAVAGNGRSRLVLADDTRSVKSSPRAWSRPLPRR